MLRIVQIITISHQLAAAEWLYQGAPRIKVAFTPGALAAEKVALAMGLKLVLVCHNKAHKDFVEKIGIDHVREQLDKPGANTFKVVRGDVAAELAALKPPRYEVLEAQRASGGNKRKAEETPGEAKRREMADAFEKAMNPHAALPKTPTVPKTPMTPKAAGVPKAPGGNESPAGVPKATGVFPETPSPVPPKAPGTAVPVPEESAAQLQALLKNFGA